MHIARITYTDGTVQEVELKQRGAELALPKDVIAKSCETVDFLLDGAVAKEGDAGYFVVENRLIHFVGHEEGVNDTGFGFMHFFGVKKEEKCFIAILTGLWEQHHFVQEKQGDMYRVYPRFMIEGCPIEEDMALKIVELTGEEADYSGMARAYRKHQFELGVCKPIRERGNVHVDYMQDAIEVRVRMGWKPVPTPVEVQTRENEPPMHVAITFDQVGELMEECKKAGIDKAEFCLVGWNVRGHDGRWPECFPVEPALGGEEGLRRLVKKAEGLGYKLVCHTNSVDCYQIAEMWTDELPMRKRDGSWAKNAQWGGGRMYDLCPVTGEQYCYPTLDGVRELGFKGLHYIDVMGVVAPRRCFSDKHPCSQKEYTAALRRMAEYSTQCVGGFQSEGGFDHLAGVIDMGLYTDFHMQERRSLYADDNVPIWQMVYHDVILSNPGTITVNYAIKDAESRLKFFEFGGHPSAYVYSKFRAANHWMGYEDIVCDTPEEVQCTVAALKQMYEEYIALGDIRKEAMVKHERQGELAIITYESGKKMVCNYAAEEKAYGGTKIPAMDFVIL